jgi:hypothetical protein
VEYTRNAHPPRKRGRNSLLSELLDLRVLALGGTSRAGHVGDVQHVPSEVAHLDLGAVGQRLRDVAERHFDLVPTKRRDPIQHRTNRGSDRQDGNTQEGARTEIVQLAHLRSPQSHAARSGIVATGGTRTVRRYAHSTKACHK